MLSYKTFASLSYLSTSSRKQLAIRGYPNRHWPYNNKHFKTFYKINGLINWRISDHHKMIITIFRSTFAKGKPKTFSYPCYKKFNLERFQIELKKKQMKFSTPHLIFFLKTLKHVLINLLNSKRKKIGFTNSIFMTKSFRKTIMLRSELKTNFNNNKPGKNSKKYKH